MKRRSLIKGGLGALIGIVTDRAKAAFGIFQVNGPSAAVQVPSGVAFQPIDGGPTYFATNGYTKATAPSIWNALGRPGNPTIPYAGWDDPKFFSIGSYLSVFNNQTDADNWILVGQNTASTISGGPSTQLALFGSNGICLKMYYAEYGAFTALGETVGAETVGWYTQDEPTTTEQLIKVPILGNASSTFTNATITSNSLNIAGSVTGGVAFPNDALKNPPILTGAGITGSGTTAQIRAYQGSTGGNPGGINFAYATSATANVSNITITQAAIPALTSAEIAGRFTDASLAGKSFFSNTPLVLASSTGNINLSTILTTAYTAADSSSRTPSMLGYDVFFFDFANQPAIGGNQLSVSNVYDTTHGSRQMTIGEVAKGPHYGNMLDYFRAVQSPPYIPLWAAFETSNAVLGSTGLYDVQGVEINWGVWSSIIHGARSVVYFSHNDGFSPSGCSGDGGSNNFICSYMLSAQTASFTGSIGAYSGGVATLAASSVTGNICPGMVSATGVSGQVVILQQQQTVSSIPGKADNYTVAAISGAGTGSGAMTFTQSNIGMGGNGAPFSFTNKGMTACVTQTNTRVRDMAPVINSPFAVVNTGQTMGAGQGYVVGVTVSAANALAYAFPSDTGVKNSFPPQSFAFGTAGSSGTLAARSIDCCAKLYQGGTYTTSLGDTISNGFYIFATTRFQEDHTPNFSVTFTINDPFATSITAIGESRANLTLTAAGTNAATFTDTFDFAWTVRIYRVNH